MFPTQGPEAALGLNYGYQPPANVAGHPGLYGPPPPIQDQTPVNGYNPNYQLANNLSYNWAPRPPDVPIVQTNQLVQIHTDGYMYAGNGNPIASYGQQQQQQQYWNPQQYPPPMPMVNVPPPPGELASGGWYGGPPPVVPAQCPPSMPPNYYSGNVNLGAGPAPAPIPAAPIVNEVDALTKEQDAHANRTGKPHSPDRLSKESHRSRVQDDKEFCHGSRRRSPRRRSLTRSPDRHRRRDSPHRHHSMSDHKHMKIPERRRKSSGEDDKTRRRGPSSSRCSRHEEDYHRDRSRHSERSRRTPMKEAATRERVAEIKRHHLSRRPDSSRIHYRPEERRRSPIKRRHSQERQIGSSKSQYNSQGNSSRSSYARDRQEKRPTERSKCKITERQSGSSTKRVVASKSSGRKEDELLKTSEDEDDELDGETLGVEKWIRSAPAELYYRRDVIEMKATERTQLLCKKFATNLLQRAKNARSAAEALGEGKMKELIDKEAKEYGDDDSSTSDSEESSADDDKGSRPSRSTAANRELERRKLHPRRLHLELWHNDPGLMNDGPVCRCSAKARRFGIRHGFYPGEDIIYKCDPYSNNPSKLFHYRITVSPAKNFLVNSPTVIVHDGHEYLFEGFSLLSHYELDLKLPPCKVIRFNIRYDVFVEKESHPESFCVSELNLFETYLFREILELVDLKQDWEQEAGCSQFHLMPRFVRGLPDNGKEILSMNRVLLHLLKHDKDLVKEDDLSRLLQVEQKEWQNFADKHKGMVVTKWGMKPSALRVDQIDREIAFDKDGSCNSNEDGIPYPLIVHFGIRPPQLSYAGNSGYQRAWRRYVKYRHLLSNMPKPSIEEKRKLVAKDLKLRQMRTASTMKRDVTVDISAKGFRTTGICCDIVQHAMLIPVLVGHLRFHKSLVTLEKRLQYSFQNPYLLQLAMTHPSYRENFGTNPDHARNALTNCGIRQPEYGDRRIHYSSTRKRGINTLINIMARFGADDETESEITHNERLEFLGDAVVEFATSIHLFHLFPDLEEGGLATYRAAIVQNQHLAELAQNLQLDQYMLYAHGSDLCHDSELRHAMANCFEALMGAVFLDGGIEVADRIFGRTLFEADAELYDIWTNYPKHPLQAQEPKGDRHWIETHGGVLKKLTEFEELIGLEFNHIRLLARAFTDRSLGYNHLSRGSNQRLEFLGDTVLQLISSEYLYRHFPDHHEGHLSLLRSSLVNNRTQSLVCDDLGMTSYAMRGDPKVELKTKDRADLLEAFLGALYIDKGLKYCVVFCSVCFIPRLSTSIIKQEWNDPKSKLQQCCLTLRTMDGNEPDIPQYKITESKGPTNTRVYVVAVFFRGVRLATAEGHSIQEAEMNAASNALRESASLFPQLTHQRRIISKTKKRN